MRYAWAMALLTTATLATVAPDDARIAGFSMMAVGGPIIGWSPLRPAPKARDTRYALVDDGGTVVLEADAQASMSGLTHPVRVDLARQPQLRWRWKVAAPLATADLRTKAGDDYAARVYVLFDYPRRRLPLPTRVKLKLAEAFYGQAIPTAALNYVWDNRAPVGTVRPNAYTGRARMIVLESGSEKAGQWATETRDLAADFRLAFGEAPPPVIAIALATDTDNTGETARAWYGDFEFVSIAAGADH